MEVKSPLEMQKWEISFCDFCFREDYRMNYTGDIRKWVIGESTFFTIFMLLLYLSRYVCL